jgi:DNA-directed RNA polymerase specialized sigma24 family protein
VGIDDGYDSFYRAEYLHVVRTSYLIVHDRQRAEDVAQEAFIQLLTHWKKVSRYEQPGA